MERVNRASRGGAGKAPRDGFVTCPHCSEPISSGSNFCVNCGAEIDDTGRMRKVGAPDRPPREAPVTSGGGDMLRWGTVGLGVGLLLGIVTRPAVPLIGQLPIGTVLTRGASLTGMDMLLKSTAESSFNHIMIVGVIGAAVGAGVGWYVGQKREWSQERR